MKLAPAAPVDLRAERLRRGLSAKAAAEAIGEPVNEDSLLWAERTRRRPSPANAAAIATFYGLDVMVQWPLDDAATDAQEVAA